MNTAKLTPETQLLLALAHSEMSQSQRAHARELLVAFEGKLDFGVLVDQSARHGVLPLIGRNLTRYNLHRRESQRDLIPYPWLFSSAYLGNRTRNVALADEFGMVMRAFNARDLRYAIRKGPVLTEHIYHDVGARRMADIDVLIRRADAGPFAEVLASLGYVQGLLDETGTRVVPFARSTQVYWRVNLNNQLPYFKAAYRDEVVQFEVDLCMSLFQPRSGGDAPVDELLDRSVELWLCGERGRALCLVDQLLDLCAHLHKEATALFYITAGDGLKLQQFQDVALTCRAIDERGDWDAFHAQVTECHAEPEVYYALHFTDILYPGYVPAKTLDRLRPPDLSYLEEYGHAEGKPAVWRDPFLVRLFDANRRNQITETTTIPRV